MFSSGREKPRDDFVQDPAFGFSTTTSSRSMTISCSGSRVEVSGCCFSSSMFCAPGQATMRLFLEEEKKGGLGVAVGARTLPLPFAKRWVRRFAGKCRGGCGGSGRGQRKGASMNSLSSLCGFFRWKVVINAVRKLLTLEWDVSVEEVRSSVEPSCLIPNPSLSL